MPIFQCEKCGCIENTAVCNYWIRNLVRKGLPKQDNPALCSECDPEIGVWHGFFEKESAVGYCLGEDGFLYDKIHTKSITHTKIIGVLTDEGVVEQL